MSQLFIDGNVIMGSPTAGNPLTQDYTPSTPISGMLYVAYSLGSQTPRDFDVTYSGLPMTKIAEFVHDAASGNDAVLYIYFVGAGLPDDVATRQAEVTFHDGSSTALQGLLWGVCYTDDAFNKLPGQTLTVVDTSTFSGTTVDPTLTLDYAGDFLPVALNVSGVDAVASISPDANSFSDREVDRGAEVAAWYSYGGSSPMAANGSWTLGWVAASDTAGILGAAVAVGEPEEDSQADGLNATLTDHFQWKHRPYIKIGSTHGPLSRTA